MGAPRCKCGVLDSVSHYCSALDHCWVGADVPECRCDCVNCVTNNHNGCYYQPSTCPVMLAHASALGRKGGLANKGKTSEAKAAAARENGKRGGRPKKVADEK